MAALPDFPPLLLTVEEAAQQLGIARTRVFGLMNAGDIPRIKIGKSTRIAYADLEGFVARLRAHAEDDVDRGLVRRTEARDR